MNNSKMWLVVNPTVGVPLFLSAVAVGSFAVHVAVLSNTTWVSDFLSGNELGSGASAALNLDNQTTTQQATFVTDPPLPAATTLAALEVGSSLSPGQ
ncbi:MAG: light-harvesting protein [Sedimentitalea sp.]